MIRRFFTKGKRGSAVPKAFLGLVIIFLLVQVPVYHYFRTSHGGKDATERASGLKKHDPHNLMHEEKLEGGAKADKTGEPHGEHEATKKDTYHYALKHLRPYGEEALATMKERHLGKKPKVGPPIQSFKTTGGGKSNVPIGEKAVATKADASAARRSLAIQFPFVHETETSPVPDEPDTQQHEVSQATQAEEEGEHKRKRIQREREHQARTGPLTLTVTFPQIPQQTEEPENSPALDFIKTAPFVSTIIEIDRCKHRTMAELASIATTLAQSQGSTSAALLFHNCPSATDQMENDLERERLRRRKLRQADDANIGNFKGVNTEARREKMLLLDEKEAVAVASKKEYFDWKKKSGSEAGGDYSNVVVIELQQSGLPSATPHPALEGMVWEALPAFFQQFLQPSNGVERGATSSPKRRHSRLLFLGPGVVPEDPRLLLNSVSTVLQNEAEFFRQRKKRKDLSLLPPLADHNIYGCTVAANRSQSLFVVSGGVVAADAGRDDGAVLDDHLAGFSAWDSRVRASASGDHLSDRGSIDVVHDEGGDHADDAKRKTEPQSSSLTTPPPGLLVPSPYCLLLPTRLLLKYWRPSPHHEKQRLEVLKAQRLRAQNHKLMTQRDWPFILQEAAAIGTANSNDPTATSGGKWWSEFYDRHIVPHYHEGLLTALLSAKLGYMSSLAIHMMPEVVVGDFPGWSPTGSPLGPNDIAEGLSIERFSSQFQEHYGDLIHRHLPASGDSAQESNATGHPGSFLQGISVTWDTFCLKCFGFSNEVMHYIVALENQMHVYSTLDAAGCFCGGTPRSFQSALKRMSNRKQFLEDFAKSAVADAERTEEETRLRPGEEFRKFRRSIPEGKRRALTAFVSHKDPGSWPRGSSYTGFRRRPDIVIGRAMYEFTQVPTEWLRYKKHVDEIWVPSRFVRYVFEQQGFDRDRLFILPEPIDVFQYDPLIVRPLRLPIRASSMHLASKSSSGNVQDRAQKKPHQRAFPKKGKKSAHDQEQNHQDKLEPVWKHTSTRIIIEDQLEDEEDALEEQQLKLGTTAHQVGEVHRREKLRNAKGHQLAGPKKKRGKEEEEFPSITRTAAEKHYKFLSVFKWEERKAWDVLLDAFLTEFTFTEPVSLYLVSYIYGDSSRSAHRMMDRVKEHLDSRIRAAGDTERKDEPPAGDMDTENSPNGEDRGESGGSEWPKWPKVPHIEIISEQLSEADLISLYRSVDAFVLPTRGEGWGLPIIQAMSMGLPTIATNWSGNVDFMTEETSYPLSVEELQAVPEDSGYGSTDKKGKLWAQPSTNHLKMLMRHLVTSPKEAKDTGRRARQHIVENYSEEVIAQMVKQRLAFLRDEYWGMVPRTSSGGETKDELQVAVRSDLDDLWKHGHLIM